MPGFAACVGALPTVDQAVALARDLQERNILVFMSASTNGTSMAEQLEEAGIEMSWDTFLVPYGKDISATVLALGFAARAAMTFGGITPKGFNEARKILLYNRERVNAFVLALGDVDDEKYATAAGAINFGFPVIADTDIPQILPSGICKYEHVVSNIPLDQMAEKAIEVRGLKIQTTKIPFPVRHGPAFEGERVRKNQVAVEFGGKFTKSFELLLMRELDEVENGKIRVVGPEIDDVENGTKLPLAIVVEVAGRKMQKDFESILERRIHSLISEIMGVMHLGQRNINWIRISKDAKNAGFKIAHMGTVLHAKLMNDFPAIVDKVEVTLYTNSDDVEQWYPKALQAYDERDRRMGNLTDESVDTFYSCALCQSYAPNHVCIITPERLGLCGAYNWLDGKAAYEINPTGGNQPVQKGDVIDPVKGKWKGVNDFLFKYSNRTLETFSAYSIIDDPMTSCGCFECIAAILPGTNGIMVVDREFEGMTPAGMTFSTLAQSVGGGVQTPGFIGIGTLYILSRKFISADGGLKRLVWMTSNIKAKIADRLQSRAEEDNVPDLLEKIADETVTKIADRLQSRAEEDNVPDLLEKIADETVTSDLGELVEYLTSVNHPAMQMEELI